MDRMRRMAKMRDRRVGGYFPPEVEERRDRYYAMVEREAERAARRERERVEARAVRKAGGDQPGYDGRRSLVTDNVVSPFDPSSRQTVVRNARHDPVEQLYQQRDRKGRRLIDEPERLAGIEIRRMVEALGLDAVRAIVLGERVDGGGKYYDIGARRYEAGKRIAALRRDMGRLQFEVLVRIAGYGETVTLVAVDFERDDGMRVNGACDQQTRKSIGWLFRESLVEAAMVLGYRPRGVHRMTAWAAPGAKPSVDGHGDGA